MRINKIYISAFGKLKDFTLELNGGMNVIFGENENGKTTVMSFIKMMFYGSSSRLQKQLSARKKYIPWSGDKPAGRIDFEHEGRRYQLERIFGKTESSDKITLINRDTGENLGSDKDVGRRFFGLSEQAFERSLFTDSSVFLHDASAEDEIGTKLSNLLTTGDEENSCKAVLENISKTSYKLISKNNKGGSIRENEAKLSELTREYDRSVQRISEREIKENKLSDLSLKIKKLKSELEITNSLLDNAKKIEEAEKIRRFLNAETELEALKEKTALKNGVLLDSSVLTKLSDLQNRLNMQQKLFERAKSDLEKAEAELSSIPKADESSNENLSELKKEQHRLSEHRNEIDEEYRELNKKLNESSGNQAVKNNKNGIIFMILTILFFITASMLFVISKPLYGAVLYALSAVSFTVFAILNHKASSKRKEIEEGIKLSEQRLADLRIKRTDLSENISRINEEIFALSQNNSDKAALKAMKEKAYSSALENFEAEANKLSFDKKELLSFEDNIPFGENSSAEEYLKRTLSKISELSAKTALFCEEIGNISAEEAKRRLLELNVSENTEDTEALRVRQKQQQKQIIDLNSDYSALKSEIESEFKDIREPENIRKETDLLKQKIKSAYDFYNASAVASSIILECSADLRQSYGSGLESKTAEILSLLTDGKYKTVNIAKTLEPTAEGEVFGMKEADYFSRGTCDQIYLSMRLALAQLVSSDGPLPVFLDDALSQYDDTRAKNAIKALKSYSESSQVLFFTCHSSICAAAEKEGIPVKCLT